MMMITANLNSIVRKCFEGSKEKEEEKTKLYVKLIINN